jgi:ditrans,polycis-polyprenyl diphosphate synthase
VIHEATELTKNNQSCVLNVAFAYTSREEMTQSVKKVCQGVKNQTVNTEQISKDLLEQGLYTHLSGFGLTPDLLIRTSGESRLSDFLLWQTSYSVTYFTQVLWPDFSLRNFIYAIFYYQRRSQYKQTLLPDLANVGAEPDLANIVAEPTENSSLDVFFHTEKIADKKVQ